MTEIVLTSPGDNIDVGFTWSGLGSATLSNVVHAAPTGLTKVSESTDTVAGTSMVRLSGWVHGGLYQVTATATLSTGRTLERSATVRAFAGAS